LVLQPSGRYSNSAGFASLAANYFHLDTNLQFTNELESTTLQGELARDSSLYHAGGFVNGIGVRRDTAATAADWTRLLTERGQLQLDASWSRVNYGQTPGEIALIDYKYLTAGPTYAYTLSELNTLKVISSFGQYQSRDGLTESKSENLQLGFVRQLDELWSLSLTGGYSHSANAEKLVFGNFYFGSLSTSQNSSVYSATLTRKSEQLTFSGAVSQALQPTGLAYLSLQDSVNVSVAYTRSERWDYALNATWQRARNPLTSAAQAALGAANLEVKYLNVQFTANWHWTEQWIVSMHVMRLSQQYGPPPVSGASSGVSVDMVRQFLRHDL
jgi:hypothetical protein